MSKYKLPHGQKASPLENPGGKALGILVAGTLIIGILGIPALFDLQIQRIIKVKFTDVSESAQNYKFSDPKQTYKSVLEELCRYDIELWKEGDVVLNGKFAAQVAVTQNTTFYNNQKQRLLRQCEEAATVPDGITNKKGTPLLPSLKRIQTETQAIRRQHQHQVMPVAVTLVIQDDDRGSDEPPENLGNIKATIQEIVKDNGVIAIVGPNVELQRQLAETLADVPNTRVCTFADDKECTEWVVETARRLKGKSSK